MQHPELLKVREEIDRVAAKIRNSEKELTKKKEEQKKQGKEIAKLHRDLEDVSAAMNDLNEQDGTGRQKLQLAESQLQEYHRM